MNLEELQAMIKGRWSTFREEQIIIQGEAGYMNMRFIAYVNDGEITKVTELTEPKMNYQRLFEGVSPRVIWERK
jgi:hypothetical protein